MKLGRIIISGLVVLVFLVTSMYAQSGGSKISGSISLGGMYTASKLGYAYEFSTIYLEEPLQVTDDVAAKGLLGINLSAGFHVTPRIEMFAGMSYMKTGRLSGKVWISIPSEYYFNEIATDTDLQDRSATQLDLLFGVRFHVAPSSQIDPYLGVGACFASAALQFMNDVTYFDIYDDELYHSVDIDEVELVKMNARALGGFIMGGLEIGLVPRVALYAEGLYKFARKTVVHPFSSAVESPEDIDLNLGGFAGSAGLRIRF